MRALVWRLLVIAAVVALPACVTAQETQADSGEGSPSPGTSESFGSLVVSGTLEIASYRYAGLVAPFLGPSVRVGWQTSYARWTDAKLAGTVSLRSGYLQNLLGTGGASLVLIPIEVEQRTTARFGDRYELFVTLGSGVMLHVEPENATVPGFAVTAGAGNSIRVLPWMDLLLAIWTTHTTPRGVDVHVTGSSVGLNLHLWSLCAT